MKGLARETGLEPATSGVTGRRFTNDFRGAIRLRPGKSGRKAQRFDSFRPRSRNG